jgi:hypothetical protein
MNTMQNQPPSAKAFTQIMSFLGQHHKSPILQATVSIFKS